MDFLLLTKDLFTNLHRLDLSNNYFTVIPTNILSNAAAANLVELDLSGNSISSLTMTDFVQRFRVSC